MKVRGFKWFICTKSEKLFITDSLNPKFCWSSGSEDTEIVECVDWRRWIEATLHNTWQKL